MCVYIKGHKEISRINKLNHVIKMRFNNSQQIWCENLSKEREIPQLPN